MRRFQEKLTIMATKKYVGQGFIWDYVSSSYHSGIVDIK